jgi:hypothetical protein
LIPQFVPSKRRADHGQNKIYERYIQAMTFSHDDEQLVAAIRNGPEQSVVKCYDVVSNNNSNAKS